MLVVQAVQVAAVQAVQVAVPGLLLRLILAVVVEVAVLQFLPLVQAGQVDQVLSS
jgi:hypothetical protein